jgi:hypothetical protein
MDNTEHTNDNYKQLQTRRVQLCKNTKHSFFCCGTGLPDGLKTNQQSQLGKKFQGLRLENVGIFYGHLEYFMNVLGYFMTIRYTLW